MGVRSSKKGASQRQEAKRESERAEMRISWMAKHKRAALGIPVMITRLVGTLVSQVYQHVKIDFLAASADNVALRIVRLPRRPNHPQTFPLNQAASRVGTTCDVGGEFEVEAEMGLGSRAPLAAFTTSMSQPQRGAVPISCTLRPS